MRFFDEIKNAIIVEENGKIDIASTLGRITGYLIMLLIAAPFAALMIFAVLTHPEIIVVFIIAGIIAGIIAS